MYQAKQYIKFLLKSTNQHSVHSPFVFNLVTKCFYDKTNYPEYASIQNYREHLLRYKDYIEVHDLGPGSKKIKNSKRKISEIAKTSGTSSKRAQLLFRLSKYFKPQTILELGTSLGIGTHALSLGNPKSQITTVEGCPRLSKFTKDNIKSENNSNFKVGDFSNVIKSLNNENFDLVFFDGNHREEATLDYFEMLLPKAHNDSVFVFDDIYWSKGMTEAWEIIKQHPKVTVTIDTFQWGFVFFRQEQVKEDFVVRV